MASSSPRTIRVFPPDFRSFGKPNTSEKPASRTMTNSELAMSPMSVPVRDWEHRPTSGLLRGMRRLGNLVEHQATAHFFHRNALRLVRLGSMQFAVVVRQARERATAQLLGAHRRDV